MKLIRIAANTEWTKEKKRVAVSHWRSRSRLRADRVRFERCSSIFITKFVHDRKSLLAKITILSEIDESNTRRIVYTAKNWLK